jgi:hypothetical protein
MAEKMNNLTGKEWLQESFTIWSNIKKRRVIFCALQMKKSGEGHPDAKDNGGCGEMILWD